MRQPFLVDSSVWVAYFMVEAKDHDRAVETIIELRRCNQEIILPQIVFVETLNVAKRKFLMTALVLEKIKKYFFGTKYIRHCNFAENFLKNKIINVIIKSNLKSSDMQILAHATENNGILLTFDKKLDEQYNNLISNEE